MSTHIVIRTLGTVTIEIGARRIGPSSGRLFALVLYLASRRGHPVSRRIAQELLFPAAPDGHAAHSLRQLLYRLRQIAAPIETDSDLLSLPLDHVSVDWWRIVSEERADLSDLERLSHGLFPGFSPDISDQYREWFEAERAEASLRLRRAITHQIVQLRRAARWDHVNTAASALLALDPLSEEGTLARAEVLAIAGSKTAALSVIEQYLQEVGGEEPHLRVAPGALRRRISERLPELGQRTPEERVFVGREEVMRTLGAIGAATQSGSQRVMLLWGEAGIGKTRVLCEYRVISSLQGAITQMLTCQAHDVHRPLGTMSDLVIALFQLPGALGCDPDARALLERLVNVSTHIGPALETTHAAVPLSAIVRSVSDLVSAIVAEAPLVILIDDAQWMDRESLLVLLGALAGPMSRRSCLIMGARDRALLAGADSYTDRVSLVRLNPLDATAASELARSLLRLTAGVEARRVEDEILIHARGNPFFIHVMCSHFSATKDYDSLKHTIIELLAKRLEQLSAEATRVLETCVVLAKNSTYNRLESALQIPRYRLLQAIEELDDRGLVEVHDGGILSSHALLSASVVRRMSRPVFQTLHAAVANQLQQDLEPGGGSSLPWDCAEHWRQAGEHSRAISILRDCGRRALDIGRPADAFATYQRALTLQSSDQTRLELLEEALKTLWSGINFCDAQSLLSERKRLRATLGLSPETHDSYEILEFASVFHSDEDPRLNVPRLRECIGTHDATPAHRMHAIKQLIMVADLALDAELARWAFDISETIRAEQFDRIVCDLLYNASFGNVATAAARAGEMLALVSSDPERHLVILLDLAYAEYRIGDCAAARAHALEALASSQRNGMLSGESYALLLLSQICWSVEHVDESRTWHDRLGDILSRNAIRGITCDYCILGARLAVQRGDYPAAQSFIKRAHECPQAQVESPRMLLAACELQLPLRLGESEDLESTLDDCVSLHLRARAFGGQDEVMVALVQALLNRARVKEAGELLRDYAQLRRKDRHATRTDLQTVSATLGFDFLRNEERQDCLGPTTTSSAPVRG